jgi:hypothetical protein
MPGAPVSVSELTGSRFASNPVSGYRKCQKICPNSPENPLFEKSRFSGPFRQKLLTYSEIMLALFRSIRCT